MQTLTHNNLCRMFAPWIPMKKARLMNNIIDNPSRLQKAMHDAYMYNATASYRRMHDQFGLGKRTPHRWNHNMAMAGLAGYMSMGNEGMYLSQLHLMADYWSDILKHQWGRRGRDIWEAMFNYYM